jgi:membrane protease YdiL (CAAX protease family)
VLVLSFVVAQAVDMSGNVLLAIALVGGGLEVVLLIVAWWLGPRRHGRSWASLGLARTFNGGASLALGVFLASVGFSILYAFAVWLLGLDAMSPTQLPGELLDTFVQRMVLFGLVVAMAPFAEEVFFRGFLLPAFSARWGFLWGTVAVSALFGIVHGAGSLIPAFVSGMLLAWLYRRTRSLWNCWLAHSAQNALAFAAAVSI